MHRAMSKINKKILKTKNTKVNNKWTANRIQFLKKGIIQILLRNNWFLIMKKYFKNSMKLFQNKKIQIVNQKTTIIHSFKIQSKEEKLILIR
jgi:hypothetical protein